MATSGNSIQIRSAEIGDCRGLAELQCAVFAASPAVEEVEARMRWKYFDNPFGAPLLAVAECESRILGVYGGMPFPTLFGGELRDCILCTTTAVHEDWRNRGIYRQLQEVFFELIKQRGPMPMMYGFPNPLAHGIDSKSTPYHVALYFRDYLVPLRHSAQLATLPPAARLSGLSGLYPRLLRKLHQRLESSAYFRSLAADTDLRLQRERIEPADMTDFLESMRESFHIQWQRNEEAIRWRYFQEPYLVTHFCTLRKGKELVGYFAFEPHHISRVFDFYCLEKYREEAFHLLLEYATRCSGSQYLRFATADAQVERLLSSSGALVRNAVPLVVNRELFEYFMHSAIEQPTRLHSWYIGGSEWFLG